MDSEPNGVERVFVRSHLQARLKAAVSGAYVNREAVDAVVSELEAALSRLLEETRARYERDMELRRIHGLRHHGYVRADHVTGDDSPRGE